MCYITCFVHTLLTCLTCSSQMTQQILTCVYVRTCMHLWPRKQTRYDIAVSFTYLDIIVHSVCDIKRSRKNTSFSTTRKWVILSRKCSLLNVSSCTISMRCKVVQSWWKYCPNIKQLESGKGAESLGVSPDTRCLLLETYSSKGYVRIRMAC